MKKSAIKFSLLFSMFVIIGLSFISCESYESDTVEVLQSQDVTTPRFKTVVLKGLTPTADAYVRGGTSGAINYGTATTLAVKKGTDANFFRKSYIKFDITNAGFSSITSAKIRLYASVVNPFSITAYQTGDSWTETGITWNNAPAVGTAIKTVSVSAVNSYYEWDITAYAQSQLRSDKIISVVLNDAGTNNLEIDFNSREAISKKPELIINGNASKVIILKLDNIEDNAASRAGFTRVAGILQQKGIKGTFGIVGNSLEYTSIKQSYYDLIKGFNAKGNEIFHHGYDHSNTPCEEFRGNTYDYQYTHIKKTIDLLAQYCGITCKTFGAPYNHSDQTTVTAMNQFPQIKAWLLAGTDITVANQLVLNDRADMEAPMYVVNYDAFVTNFNAQSTKKYLVVQGHPTKWTETDFTNIVRIIDFLQSKGCVFMTPNEYFLNQ